MANSTFAVAIGKGSNPRMIRGLKSGRILHAWAPWLFWRQVITLADFTPAAATSQDLNLHTLFPNNLFPANVIRGPGVLRQLAAFGGGSISAFTAALGDDDNDGIVTATNMFTGQANGYKASTVSAAEYAPRVETDYIPHVGLASTSANLSALTAGSLEAIIAYRPLPA